MLYVVFRMIVELLHLFVVAFCLHSGIFIRAKRVSNCYIPPQKYVPCACVRLILVLVGGRQTAIIVVVCTYYVPHTYVPMHIVLNTKADLRPVRASIICRRPSFLLTQHLQAYRGAIKEVMLRYSPSICCEYYYPGMIMRSISL